MTAKKAQKIDWTDPDAIDLMAWEQFLKGIKLLEPVKQEDVRRWQTLGGLLRGKAYKADHLWAVVHYEAGLGNKADSELGRCEPGLQAAVRGYVAFWWEIEGIRLEQVAAAERAAARQRAADAGGEDRVYPLTRAQRIRRDKRLKGAAYRSPTTTDPVALETARKREAERLAARKARLRAEVDDETKPAA